MIPKTLHYIKFFNAGAPGKGDWWVEKSYTDLKGEEHTVSFRLDPDASFILEYVYLDCETGVYQKIVIED
jgi:hypothetical protein